MTKNWEVWKGFVLEDGRTVCMVEDNLKSQKDLHLISAAPDLLDALLDLKYMLYGDARANPKIERAISKAKGLLDG